MTKAVIVYFIALSLSILTGCGGGGSDSGTGGTGGGNGSSNFNGTFNGLLTISQGGRDIADTFDLNLTAASPLSGTFFRHSDGAVGRLSGDVEGDFATFNGTIESSCSGSFSGSMTLTGDGSLSIEASGADCDGSFNAAGTLVEIACINIEGGFQGEERVSVTCTLAGVSETIMAEGGGTINLVQDGCHITYLVPQIEITREGDIEGNILTLSGPFIIPADESVILTENSFMAEVAIIDQDNFTFNGLGSARGTAQGMNFSCTGDSTGTLTRLSTASISSTAWTFHADVPQFSGVIFGLHGMTLNMFP